MTRAAPGGAARKNFLSYAKRQGVRASRAPWLVPSPLVLQRVPLLVLPQALSQVRALPQVQLLVHLPVPVQPQALHLALPLAPRRWQVLLLHRQAR